MAGWGSARRLQNRCDAGHVERRGVRRRQAGRRICCVTSKSAPTPVYLEVGAKRVFASAADWPGWTRAGKDEKAALEALAAAVPKYALVAKAARVAAGRMSALVSASWTVFDRTVENAPPSLRKGPRGGGRDRDAIVEHVLSAEIAYARKLGLRLQQPAVGDAAAIRKHRNAIVAGLRAGTKGTTEGGWPARYAARRIAWHAVDHAWEIEDRSD
jgi:hypothetical protein